MGSSSPRSVARRDFIRASVDGASLSASLELMGALRRSVAQLDSVAPASRRPRDIPGRLAWLVS